VYGRGFRVQGLEFIIQGLGYRVWSLGFRISGLPVPRVGDIERPLVNGGDEWHRSEVATPPRSCFVTQLSDVLTQLKNGSTTET
jgi:hypothetical protein